MTFDIFKGRGDRGPATRSPVALSTETLDIDPADYVADEALTNLVYAADRTVVQSERKRILGDAQVRIADLAVEIPLYGVTKLDAVPTRLRGFTGNPTNTGPFWNVHEWTLVEE